MRKRWRPGGEIVELHVFEDPLAVPDGLTLDRSGNLYVTSTAAAGVHVLSSQGTPIGFLAVGQVPTNCAFGAAGILLVTAGGHTGTDTAAERGSLLAVEVDTEGQVLFPGRLALSGQVS